MTTPIPLPPVEEAPGAPLAKYLQEKVLPQFERERDRLAGLALWMEGRQPIESTVRTMNSEKRVLQKISKTPWLGLAVSVFAQAMYVDGYRPASESENSKPWDIWVRNNLPAQQIAIHRAAIGYGYCYAKVTPILEDGVKRAQIRGISPRRMYAMWDDPINDDFPEYTFELLPDNKTYRWTDSLAWYDFVRGKNFGKFELVDVFEHNIGVVPVVRYTNQMDLDGRCLGDVEPVISLAARIDKTDYDRLLAQHFNSWKVRWATGLEQGATPEDSARDKLKLAQEDMLVTENPLAKFGTLEETALDPFINAKNNDVESLAAILQLPSSVFTGAVVNVSADALDASRRQTVQKLLEKQMSMGHTHGKLLRLASAIEGDDASALDDLARVSWQDVEIRSLAQAADAWGKLVTQLGMPKEFAWGKVPGITNDDVTWMKDHALDDDKLSKYLRELNVKPDATQAPGAAKTGAPKTARPATGGS